jgi:FlaA1/EpsC-like NDP-sugar epimerase
MPKPLEKLSQFLVDFITINLAFFAWGYLRLMMGFDVSFFVDASFVFKLKLSFLVYLYWLFLFLFLGLYISWYTKSRFDELVTLFKAVGFGIFIIFVLTIDLHRDFETPPKISRVMLLSYGVMVFIVVGIGRVIVHTIQRKLLSMGMGVRNTVIVGWDDGAQKLYDEILKFPALGYKVVGFIDTEPVSEPLNYRNIPLLGSIRQLSKIIRKERIEDVIIALGTRARKKVMDVIAQCEDSTVSLKIVPDLRCLILNN